MAELSRGSVRVSVRRNTGPADADARTVDPQAAGAAFIADGPDRGRLVEPDGRVVRALVDVGPVGSPAQPFDVEVVVRGWRFELQVEDGARAALRDRARRVRPRVEAGGRTEVRAVIPGRIASVAVVAGDRVEPGRVLLVVEAMKMQNDLPAPGSGPATIARVVVAPGDTVEVGDLLVVLEDPA